MLLLAVLLLFKPTNSQTITKENSAFWDVRSIDTVKYSRDLARQKTNDPAFDEIIERHVSKISETGATHVAIGTPYDPEFIPFLTRWVKAVRARELNVWFRGNFSGWEGWFGYGSITRDEHIKKTGELILANGDLFEDGDIFSACPECENGGPGDPRRTGDKEGHAEFLKEEYKVTNEAFRKIGKNVRSNFASMNGDVAAIIMDKEATKTLGGLVVIDHYVATPEQLSLDVSAFAQRSGGRVVLGEFGAPIPDIHGNLNEGEQAEWLDSAFYKLLEVDELLGINYWVSFGGSTSLWNSDGSPKEAADVLKKYYNPIVVRGKVVDEIGRNLVGAEVSIGPRKVASQEGGIFSIPFIEGSDSLRVRARGYKNLVYEPIGKQSVILVLEKEDEGLFFRVLKRLHQLRNRLNL